MESGLRTISSLKRADPQWRNFFEDGTVIDLWEDPEKMRGELARFASRVFEEYKAFLSYKSKANTTLSRAAIFVMALTISGSSFGSTA